VECLAGYQKPDANPPACNSWFDIYSIGLAYAVVTPDAGVN
jgi:hypothetical protein